nr:uncharacterized protein LOC109184755 [Ipomoea batatas]
MKSLKKQMKLKRDNGTWAFIDFRYERLPTFCFLCGIIGRGDRLCPKFVNGYDRNLEKPFGAWMRAGSRRTSPTSGQRWLAPETDVEREKLKSPAMEAMERGAASEIADKGKDAAMGPQSDAQHADIRQWRKDAWLPDENIPYVQTVLHESIYNALVASLLNIQEDGGELQPPWTSTNAARLGPTRKPFTRPSTGLNQVLTSAKVADPICDGRPRLGRSALVDPVGRSALADPTGRSTLANPVAKRGAWTSGSAESDLSALNLVCSVLSRSRSISNYSIT